MLTSYDYITQASSMAHGSTMTTKQWPQIETLQFDLPVTWLAEPPLCHKEVYPNFVFLGIGLSMSSIKYGCLITSKVCVNHKVAIHITVDFYICEQNHSVGMLARQDVYLPTFTQTCSFF